MAITLLKVVNAGHFWAKESPGEGMSHEAQEFHKLQTRINEHFNSSEYTYSTADILDQGSICIGRRTSDKRWYRVKVKHVLQSSRGPKANCFLLDFAENTTIPKMWLRDAPDVFLKVPYQAKEFILHGIQPVTMVTCPEDMTTTKRPCKLWDPSADEFVENLVKDCTSACVKVVSKDLQNRLHVRLYLNRAEGQVCVNDLLVEDEYAVSLTDGKEAATGLQSSTSDSEVGAGPRRQQRTEASGRAGADSQGGVVGAGMEGLTVQVKPQESNMPSGVRLRHRESRARAQQCASPVADNYAPKSSRRSNEEQLEEGHEESKLSSVGQALQPPRSSPNVLQMSPLSSPARAEQMAQQARLSPLGPKFLPTVPRSSQPRFQTLLQETIHSPSGLHQAAPPAVITPPRPANSRQHPELNTSSAVQNLQMAFSRLSPSLGADQSTKPKQGSVTLNAANDISRKPKLSPVGRGAKLLGMLAKKEQSEPCEKMGRGKVLQLCAGKNSAGVGRSKSSATSGNNCGKKLDSNFQGVASSVSHTSQFTGDDQKCVNSRKAYDSVEQAQKPGEETITPRNSDEREVRAMSSQHGERLTRWTDNHSQFEDAGAGSDTCTVAPPSQSRSAIQSSVADSLNTFDKVEQIESKTSPLCSDTDTKVAVSECGKSPESTSQRTKESFNADSLATESKKRVCFSDRGEDSECRSSSGFISPDIKTLKSILKKSPEQAPLKQTSLMQHTAFSESEEESDSGNPSSEDESQRLSKATPKLNNSGIAAGQRILKQLDGGFLDEGFHYRSPEARGQTRSLSSRPHWDDGVIVHGQPVPEIFKSIAEAPFAEIVTREINTLEFVNPHLIQAYAWPAVLRGSAVVGIAPARTGKTYTYLLPLITQLLHTSTYEALPTSSGPLALILASSWVKAQGIYEKCSRITESRHQLRTIVVYGGGAEDSQGVNLVNGCVILIATPHCLLRSLQKGYTRLDRLCHLVLDDADNLTEEFTTEVREIVKVYGEALTDQPRRSAPRQMLVFSSHWTRGIKSFVESFMVHPLIYITCKAEAAIYAGVRQDIRPHIASQRQAHLEGLLDCSLTKQKVVVFTDSEKQAQTVYKSLRAYSHYVLLATRNQSEAELEKVESEWNSQHSVDSQPILVVTDEIITEMKVTDAHCVVHFTMPTSKKIFGDRLACMRDNYQSPQEQAQKKHVRCTSYMFVTEESKKILPHFVKFLQRAGEHIPAEVMTMLSNAMMDREKGKEQELCHYFKAYGKCRDEKSCRARHLISQELDLPGTAPDHIKLPMSGQVKVKVTHVVDASCFYVRLIEHKDVSGHVTDYAQQYGQLTVKMAFWFTKKSNLTPYGPVVPGEVCTYIQGTTATAHRVKILSPVRPTKRGQKVEVFMVDTGQGIVTDISRLFVLPEQFRGIPYQAVEVFLCRIKPLDRDVEWTCKATFFMDDIVHRKVRVDESSKPQVRWRIGEEKELHGKIVLSLGNTLWLDPLMEQIRLKQVKAVFNEASLRQQLLQKKLAVENKEHLQMLYAACKDRVELPDLDAVINSPNKGFSVSGVATGVDSVGLPEEEEYHDVCLSAALSPQLFYVQLLKNIDRLEILMEDIYEYAILHDHELTQAITKGMLLAARFPHDDRWYRARVAEVLGPDKFDMFYVDYGDSEVVCQADLLPLPPSFLKLPFQAIECSLLCLLPPGDAWTENIDDVMWKVTSNSSGKPKQLVAKVESKCVATYCGSHRYSVHLYDTAAVYDVNIAHELVAAGVAVPDEQLLQAEFPNIVEQRHFTHSYEEIPILCVNLLKTADADARINLATRIQKLVSENNRHQEAIRECGGLRALCRVLKFVGDISLLQLLLTSVVVLTLHNVKNCQELVEQHAIATLCRRLENSHKLTEDASENQEFLTWTLKHLSAKEITAADLVKNGGLKLLGSIVNSTSAHIKIRDHACTTLSNILSFPNVEGFADSVEMSGCVRHLCQCLKTADNSNLQLGCLVALGRIALQARLVEQVRKEGGIHTMLEHLQQHKSNEFICRCLRVLKEVAKSSADSRKLMVSQGTIGTLASLSDRGDLTTEAVSLCKDLIRQLKLALRKKPPSPHGSNCSPVNGSASAVQELEVASNQYSPLDKLPGIRPHRVEQINNQPLPSTNAPSGYFTRSATPSIKWCQNRKYIRMSIKLPAVNKSLTRQTFTDNSFHFRTVLNEVEYVVTMDLYELIDPPHCQIMVLGSEVLVGIRKISKCRWPRLLKQKTPKAAYLSVDHENYVDSDSDTSETDEENESPFILKRRKKAFSEASNSNMKYLDAIPDLNTGQQDSFSDSSNDWKERKLSRDFYGNEGDRFNIFDVKD